MSSAESSGSSHVLIPATTGTWLLECELASAVSLILIESVSGSERLLPSLVSSLSSSSHESRLSCVDLHERPNCLSVSRHSSQKSFPLPLIFIFFLGRQTPSFTLTSGRSSRMSLCDSPSLLSCLLIVSRADWATILGSCARSLSFLARLILDRASPFFFR